MTPDETATNIACPVSTEGTTNEAATSPERTAKRRIVPAVVVSIFFIIVAVMVIIIIVLLLRLHYLRKYKKGNFSTAYYVKNAILLN